MLLNDKNIFLMFYFLVIGLCQFKMSVFQKMPNTTYSQGLVYAAMRNNNNYLYVSVKYSTAPLYRIDRWNVENSSNIGIDSYSSDGTQNQLYSYIYFFEGYILASGNSNNPKLFNQTTSQFIGTLNTSLTFGRGEYLKTKGVFFFTSSIGSVGYFNINTLPNVSLVYLHNDSSNNFCFIQKSINQQFVATSYKANNYVNIWRTSDWTLVKNISVDGPVYTQIFSPDNDYLLVFLYDFTYVTVYSKALNWSLSSNVTVGYKNVRTCFYYEQTNAIVALSQISGVFTINWFDFSAMHIYTITAWKMYTGDNGKSLTCFSTSPTNIASFFNIDPYCSNGTVYNIPTKSCVSCTTDCNVCFNSTSCSVCQSGYVIQPLNGTCKGTNNTNGANTSNNTNNQGNQQSQGYRDSNFLYQLAMGLTVQSQTIGILNKIPGSRRIFRQVFAFFLNIDHLWLYIYHKRQYGYYVNRLLKAVQLLEQQKWNLVSNEIFNKTIGVDMIQVQNNLDTKINYTSWKYIQIQGQSSSFLENSLDYFFLNVPLVLAMFFLFKLFFFLTFKYEISKIWRQYSFNAYLLLMLIQGNSESFSYLFFYDCTSLSSANLRQKVLNIVTIILFMVFIIQLISGFLMVRSAYQKNAKYFYDNYSNSLAGSTHLLIQYAFLNFCLGSIHLILEDYYNFQLGVLLTIELIFISTILKSIRKSNVYQYRHVQWIVLFSSFLRVCLIITYYSDQSFPGKYDILQQIQMYLIILYLFNWIISSLISYFLLVFEIVRFIANKMASYAKQKRNQKNHIFQKFKYLVNNDKVKKNIKIETIDGDLTQKNKKQLKIQFFASNNQNNQVSMVHKINLNNKQSKNMGLSKFKRQKLKQFITKKEKNQSYLHKTDTVNKIHKTNFQAQGDYAIRQDQITIKKMNYKSVYKSKDKVKPVKQIHENQSQQENNYQRKKQQTKVITKSAKSKGYLMMRYNKNVFENSVQNEDERNEVVFVNKNEKDYNKSNKPRILSAGQKLKSKSSTQQSTEFPLQNLKHKNQHTKYTKSKQQSPNYNFHKDIKKKYSFLQHRLSITHRKPNHHHHYYREQNQNQYYDDLQNDL